VKGWGERGYFVGNQEESFQCAAGQIADIPIKPPMSNRRKAVKSP
jgi:hypothetical protein